METDSKSSAFVHDHSFYMELANKLRKERSWLIVLLSVIMLFTVFYATLKNPFIYTFSKIGNYYGYRWLYIVWAVVVSACLHTSSILLFKLTNYNKKWAYVALGLSSFFLIVTAIIPSIREKLFFLHVLHKWTTFFFVMSTLTALHPYFVWLGRKIPKLKTLLRNWQLIILIGSMTSLILQGQTGIFELWFFLGLGTLLMYLGWVLFTEKIEEKEHYEQIKENQKC